MTHLRRIIARDVFISANAKACPMQFLKIELLNMVCLTEKGLQNLHGRISSHPVLS